VLVPCRLSVVDGTTAVDPGQAPERFALRFAGSNPVRGPARLELAMPQRGSAEVRVYDVRGSLVRELARGEFAAGQHRLTWDGRSGGGTPVGPGIYFVEVRSPLGSAQLRLVVLR
jgi:hypothetical protein